MDLTTNNLTRRGFLGTAGGAAAGLVAAGPGTSTATADPAADPAAAAGPVSIGPADTRYQDLVSRGYNGRFVAQPDVIHLVYNTAQVVAAVTKAVQAGKRVVVRSGGHCFENFVDDPQVRVLIDVTELKAVYFDAEMQAFAVEAGATLASMYRSLFLGWGVTLPGGECPKIGVGGHIAGGGFGPLSRRDGLIVDHLYAVEVVVVDRSGRARAVVATRRPSDPNRDLWWAHTGGGGGNFGIVTRYWFRSPDARGGDPTALLPRAPGSVLRAEVAWPWSDLTPAAFTRLLRNHGEWHAGDRAGSAYASLWSQLTLAHQSLGQVSLIAQLDGAVPDAERLLNQYVDALGAGVGVTPQVQQSRQPWMKVTLANGFDTGPLVRTKSKDGFLRAAWSDAQIGTIYRYLADQRMAGLGGVFVYSFGGRINTVAPDATAVAQRDSILRAWITAFWAVEEQDEQIAAWLRDFYRDLYADTGGVPAPNTRFDGTGINFPDSDLADPRWNTSGIPWHTLYYKDNYRRLQEVKARWDPRDVFHHALAVRPAQ